MTPDSAEDDQPLAQALDEMYPAEWIQDTAEETGLVERVRKLNIVVFFWTLTLGTGAALLENLSQLKRGYEAQAGHTLSYGSWHPRFNETLVAFLEQCVARGLQDLATAADAAGRDLQGKLSTYRGPAHPKQHDRPPAREARGPVASGLVQNDRGGNQGQPARQLRQRRPQESARNGRAHARVQAFGDRELGQGSDPVTGSRVLQAPQLPFNRSTGEVVCLPVEAQCEPDGRRAEQHGARQQHRHRGLADPGSPRALPAGDRRREGRGLVQEARLRGHPVNGHKGRSAWSP